MASSALVVHSPLEGAEDRRSPPRTTLFAALSLTLLPVAQHQPRMPKPKDASAAAAVAAAGGRRLLLRSFVEPKRVGKWYPTDDVPVKAKRAHKPTLAKLRASIKPGTVLILVAGRYQGRRVVFLKQLPSGLLLVTGASRGVGGWGGRGGGVVDGGSWGASVQCCRAL